MSVSTQPQFYAFIFMPYCFKPVYAVAANAFGKHRRIDKRSRACLLQICGVLCEIAERWAVFDANNNN